MEHVRPPVAALRRASPPDNIVAGHRPLARGANRDSARDPATLKQRCALVLSMHAFFTLFWFVGRHDAVVISTGGLVSGYTVVLLYAPTVAAAAYSEVTNRSATAVVASLLVLGCLVGASYPAVADAPFLRLLSFGVQGYCCGNLRFLWATRRLSRRMPHRVLARVSNFLKRTAGITPALIVGEIVGCAFVVTDGWIVISQSWYGYVLTFLFPLLLVQVAMFASTVLTSVFGGDRRHVVGRTDASRIEVVTWTATVTAATTLLLVFIALFIVTYVPYAWTNQLLMSPYALVTEVLAFRALKSASRGSSGATGGRELYKAVSRKHDQLITDMMSKSKEFHCH
jgi:hypothetical protein